MLIPPGRLTSLSSGHSSRKITTRPASGAAPVALGLRQTLMPFLRPAVSWLLHSSHQPPARKRRPIARKSIVGWWREWERRLPRVGRTLDQLEDRELDAIANAFEDLRGRQAGWRQRKTGRVRVTFGATGAAKTLYAIRPNACSPWD